MAKSVTDTLPDRGQAFAIETVLSVIFISGLILTLVLGFTYTPLEMGPEDDTDINLAERDIQRFLDDSQSAGTLKASILNYDEEREQYNDRSVLVSTGGIYNEIPNDEFGSDLEMIVDKHGVSVNIELIPHQTASEQSSNFSTMSTSQPFISTGAPSNIVASATTTIILHSNDRLRSQPDAHRTSHATVNSTTGDGPYLYEKDAEPFKDNVIAPIDDDVVSGEVYRIITVRVVIWI